MISSAGVGQSFPPTVFSVSLRGIVFPSRVLLKRRLLDHPYSGFFSELCRWALSFLLSLPLWWCPPLLLEPPHRVGFFYSLQGGAFCFTPYCCVGPPCNCLVKKVWGCPPTIPSVVKPSCVTLPLLFMRVPHY